MNHMRRILFLTFCLLIVWACDRGVNYQELLDEAQWMNQHDSLFTTDSVMLRVARHYDHWWHPDSTRMKAYYLLGCAYRDMGEAPAAIHYYNIATERADTTAKDCDFATLFRVYGQMAVIYEQQNMPLEELEAWKEYSKYAFLAKDTFNYILGYERSVGVYYLLDDTVNVFRTTEKARGLYERYGFREQSARVYPTAIYVSILNGNYARARRYMDIFENESGLFDEEGNIAQGREHYYNSKGTYYLGINEIDSAEYYFYKLLPYGHQLEACEGLLSVYRAKNNSDSIVKYATLYKEAQVQWATGRQSYAIIQSTAMYQYERNQSLAIQKQQEAKLAWSLLGTALCLVLAILYIIYKRMELRNLKKEQEYIRLEELYDEKVKEYQSLMKEYSILKHNYDKTEIPVATKELLQEKEERIKELEKDLGWYMDRNGVLDILEKERKIKEEDIMVTFESKAMLTKGWEAPSEKEWQELAKIYRQYFPLSFSSIADMPHQELYTCILTHTGFATGMIATLFKTSAQRITNVKRFIRQMHRSYRVEKVF